MSDNEKPAWWRDPSWIAALSAVVIGISALSVSFYQARLMHQQQRMSVWPHIAIANNNTEEAFYLSLSNDGVGPAQIKYIDVLYKGEAVKTWDELLKKGYQGNEYRSTYSYLNNRVIPMNTTIQVYKIPSGAPEKAFRAIGKDTQIELCYCSIYDDCYFYENSDVEKTTAVDICPEKRPHIFRN